MYHLPKWEVYFYYCIWISGISISLYHLFLVGQVFDHSYHDEYHYEDFKKGWAFLGNRFQDQADSEWNIWTKLVIRLTPFLFVNFLGAETIRAIKVLYLLPIWYTTVTVCFLLQIFNVSLTLWFIFQTFVYYIFIQVKSHIFIWLISFIIIHFSKPEIWFIENEEKQYLVMVSSSWMVLRCISYSMEILKEPTCKTNTNKFFTIDIFKLFGYSFYLPTMFCGPFISFKYFNDGFTMKFCQWTLSRILRVLKKFLKSIFWFFFTLFALHFIYVNAILLRPNLVGNLMDWELAGLGIAMGHFFHLKYVVFYGIPCAWCSAENFATPHLPCCVSRVHLYSYMWRNFDHGLYTFILRYIYIPVISQLSGTDVIRKIVASVICFAFIFIWHGEQDYVFFWVLFNYIAVTIELLVKKLSNLVPIRNFLDRNFSLRNQTRIQCLLAAPLHCFSMISNYFFIGNGVEIGFIYLKRICYGSFLTKLTVLFFLYGAGQSAVATEKIENQKKLKKTFEVKEAKKK